MKWSEARVATFFEQWEQLSVLGNSEGKPTQLLYFAEVTVCFYLGETVSY